MKRNWRYLLGAAGVMVLAGCGGEDAEEAGAGTDQDGEPEVLKVWANDEENQLEAIEALTERFTEEHGIEVEVTPFGMLDQTEAISLDGPSGQGPDLFFQPGVGDLALQGLVRPVEVDESELGQYTDSALEALSYEGELYGLPMVVETYAMYYNTDLVDDAPGTVEELEQLGADLTDPGQDEYGFLMRGTDFYFAYAFLGGYGGYVFGQDEDGVFDVTDIGLDTDGAIAGAERIQSWYDEGYLPQGVDGDIISGLFMDGNVGAVVDGPWALSDYSRALGDSLAVAPLPALETGEHPSSFIGVKGWMLSEYTEHPEWASELALFLTSEESAMYYYEQTGEMPPHPSLLEDPEIAEDPLVVGFAEQIEHGEPMPNTAELSHVWDPMADALEFISRGDDVREVLEEAVEQIDSDIRLARGE
ncbi:sugar ABC transporter substrate-binding protein [Alteribacter natronophilus]|uniref:sugar ABC transporter substrate-binding protein n=1 Tax=Alteribacter natronophilus TaxID=2583810 RepID=UPI00110F1AC5|nr:extracellular solute-binding protein [Alteribacter natronophilus]TMW72784.1 extracellular solute-binding protein [Alteribacter natronophilus]